MNNYFNDEKVKARYILAFLLSSACVFSCVSRADENIYGNLPREKYLLGEFNVYKNPQFISLKTLKIPTRGRTHYLRAETAEALERLYLDFKKDHPKIPFWVQSSTRNFYDQKYIWESKWLGKKLVFGKKLNMHIKDPLKRALEILKYSSMPGTSRHHWGTDFDINKLSNGYYGRGSGKVLYRWMKKNAHRYGFCQPYTEGRKSGYNEEKWHWSYLPLARTFLKEWNEVYGKDFESLAGTKKFFAGSRHAGHLAKIYVNAINEDCK